MTSSALTGALVGALQSNGTLNAVVSYYGRADGYGKVVFYDTTENWNSKIDFIPKKGVLIVYSDYQHLDDCDVPNIKIGDGLAYLADLPFVSDDLRELLTNHIINTTMHVTAAERDFWNNKITCDVKLISDDDYRIFFTKD